MRRRTRLLLGLSIAVTACSGPGAEFMGPWLRPDAERAGDRFRSEAGFTIRTDQGAEH